MYAAYLINFAPPIAVAETHAACLKAAIRVICDNIDDPVVGQVCRDLLAGDIGSVTNPKLRIKEMTNDEED